LLSLLLPLSLSLARFLSRCDICRIGYDVTSTGECTLRGVCAVRDCALCVPDSTTTCDTCANGFRLAGANDRCHGDGPFTTWSVCSPSHFCEDEDATLRAAKGDNSMCICCTKAADGTAQCTGAKYGYCRVENCDVCGSGRVCAICAAGYTLTQEGACARCDVDHCAGCSADNVCAACDMGYTLSGGACVAAP